MTKAQKVTHVQFAAVADLIANGGRSTSLIRKSATGALLVRMLLERDFASVPLHALDGVTQVLTEIGVESCFGLGPASHRGNTLNQLSPLVGAR